MVLRVPKVVKIEPLQRIQTAFFFQDAGEMLRGFLDFLRAFRPCPIRCVGHRAKFQVVASVLFDAKQRIDLCF